MSSRKDNWFRHLRHEADRLLREYAHRKRLARVEDIPLPVPLRELVFDLLEYDALDTTELPPDTSGYVHFGSKLIRINTVDRSKEHQYFTMAHEIGHVRLHSTTGVEMFRCPRGVIGAPSEAAALAGVWSAELRDQVRKVQVEEEKAWAARRPEIEANVFASGLVIPSAHLAQFGPVGQLDPMILARTFGVSISAMHWRLEGLTKTAEPPGQLGLFES